jgi:hypothetical protein
MQLDLRWPIGLMFLINGILLVGYGILNSTASITRVEGSEININLEWGAVLVVFGFAMSLSAYLGRNKGN